MGDHRGGARLGARIARAGRDFQKKPGDKVWSKDFFSFSGWVCRKLILLYFGDHVSLHILVVFFLSVMIACYHYRREARSGLILSNDVLIHICNTVGSGKTCESSQYPPYHGPPFLVSHGLQNL